MSVRMLPRLGRSVALWFLFSSLPSGLAQLNDATLKGMVVDPHEARISSSVITISNENTKERRSATADRDGQFVITSLAPGSYTVQVTATGFKTFYEKHVLQLGLQ
jgi:hypothetical protein